MKKIASADIVIFGGGIAGLWLLNRLRKTGLSVLLFESSALGGGQTQKAQGIIHGGLKYALQGTFTQDAYALKAMPNRWRDCLSGIGEIDLTGAAILSRQHYLWSPNKFTSKIMKFFATAALTSKVTPIEKENYPPVFRHPNFKGEIFGLDEIVLDVTSVIRELVKNNQDAVFKIEPLSEQELKFDEQGNMISATVYYAGKSLELNAQQFIFTAGAGNEMIAHRLGKSGLAMQRRPLHMVMVKIPFKHALYAHCLGIGARPRITITTHFLHDGSMIWYLGGQLAEDGVNLDSEKQIKAAHKELNRLFPWLTFQQAEFSTFLVDRAEPKHALGLKSETAYSQMIGNIIIGWPVKLALAPKLTDEILQLLESKQLVSKFRDMRELRSWPMPPLAIPVWEEAFCKSVA